jgi:hypothetical protein
MVIQTSPNIAQWPSTFEERAPYIDASLPRSTRERLLDDLRAEAVLPPTPSDTTHTAPLRGDYGPVGRDTPLYDLIKRAEGLGCHIIYEENNGSPRYRIVDPSGKTEYVGPSSSPDDLSRDLNAYLRKHLPHRYYGWDTTWPVKVDAHTRLYDLINRAENDGYRFEYKLDKSGAGVFHIHTPSGEDVQVGPASTPRELEKLLEEYLEKQVKLSRQKWDP